MLSFYVRWACVALLRIKISCPSSFCIETKSWQKPKSWKTNQFQCKQRIPPKEFLPKKSSQKSFQRIPPKKFCQKNSSKKSSGKIPKKFQKKFQKKQTKKFQKNSKQFLQNFLRFWKYLIPYIALRGRKPFRACFETIWLKLLDVYRKLSILVFSFSTI